MSDKATSSGVIKTFAKVIFIIGVILTVIFAIGGIVAGFVVGNETHAAIAVGAIIGSVLLCGR